jgi:exodeoxyribonuclease V beta subunit
MKPFDLCGVSLAPATTLIEASAGTGKTYSITGLLIRLLLERDVLIGQIVAVTFTEAATKELRDRARGRIAAAMEDLRDGHSEDPVVQSFLAGGDIAKGMDRLNLALKSFDEAQIFTIHGFCQRCLGDYAFESGAQFESTLTADSASFFEEIAYDFWRRQFYDQKPLLAAVAIAWEQSPVQWLKLLERVARHPDLEILPPPEPSPSSELIPRVEQAFAAVCAEWKLRRGQVAQVLQEDRGLSRAKDAFNPERVTGILANLALACEHFESAAPDCIGALAEVCSDAIAAGTTRKGVAPAHRFFDLCGDFCGLVTALLNRLTREFLFFARSELPKRKARANIVTYDDLILGLRDALRGQRGPKLAGLIGQRYRAALIDEFQDTDPAQYEIFRAIFGTGEHCLFYIGDPKQAIYGFRGADIFTYRQAAAAARRQAFTLTTNWRSEPKLLRALNALFNRASRPFVFDWIDYHDVHAPTLPKVLPLTGPQDPGAAALHLRLLPAPEAGKGFTQEDATALVSAQLAVDIAGLYADSAASLHYRDVAVLVRTNAQANAIQESLRLAGIRSILRTESNVFAAGEAEDLERFLQGILEPRNGSALKGALATTLFGLDARALYELELDDRKRQDWLERFLGWQDQWVNGCFIAMFRRLLVEQSVRVRLVKLPAGERRLTNFLQMAELLHEVETARHLAPDAVCAFLREQRSNAKPAEELYQLRLESDEDAVQIVTVHKAKGLEFPVVFCPFLWLPSESSNRSELLFHDRDNNDRLTVDLRDKKGGDEKHVKWQSEENRSEELRLAYVALTRAMNRCYVYVPEAKKILHSPLAHLLAADEKHGMADRIRSLVESAGGSVDAVPVHAIPTARQSHPAAAPACLAARQFTGRIPRVAMSASFTGLNTEVELDRDFAPAEEPEPPGAGASPASLEPTIFTFPRGASAGDFFHDVLENLDLENPDQLETLVAAKLRLHGFAQANFLPVICAALRNLLDLDLEPGIRLGAVPAKDIIRELDFTYPLRLLSPTRFRDILAHCPDVDPAVSTRMGRLQFRPVEGFMRGFIDVLFRCRGRFYLIDWKSNWLGPQAADYHPAHFHSEMLQRNYYLQYHLYTLAVDLFLRSRVPGYDYDRDFGGVFYVFLRGVEPGRSPQGVFRDRPSARTVAALRQLLP